MNAREKLEHPKVFTFEHPYIQGDVLLVTFRDGKLFNAVSRHSNQWLLPHNLWTREIAELEAAYAEHLRALKIKQPEAA